MVQKDRIKCWMGARGFFWVEGGIDSEVPETAVRVRIGEGLPLYRGYLAEELGKNEGWWLDMGVVEPKDGKCHTLRLRSPGGTLEAKNGRANGFKNHLASCLTPSSACRACRSIGR